MKMRKGWNLLTKLSETMNSVGGETVPKNIIMKTTKSGVLENTIAFIGTNIVISMFIKH